MTIGAAPLRQQLVDAIWPRLAEHVETTFGRSWMTEDLGPDDQRRREASPVHVAEKRHVSTTALVTAAEGSVAGLVEDLFSSALSSELAQLLAAFRPSTALPGVHDADAAVQAAVDTAPVGSAYSLWVHGRVDPELEANAAKDHITVRRLPVEFAAPQVGLLFQVGREHVWRSRVHDLALSWDFASDVNEVLMHARANYNLHFGPDFRSWVFHS